MDILIIILGLSMFILGGAVYAIKSASIKRKINTIKASQILVAARNGYIEATNGGDGDDLLMQCVILDAHKELTEVITRGGNPNKTNRHGTPLIYIAKNMTYHAEITKALIAGGADPNFTPSGGGSPLWHTANNNNDVIAKILIESGANMNVQMEPKLMTPLMTAVYQRSTEVGRLLVNAGADLTLCSSDGLTARGYAYQKADYDRGSGDSVGTHVDYAHGYNELIRQIDCILAGKKYKYRKPKKNTSNSASME